MADLYFVTGALTEMVEYQKDCMCHERYPDRHVPNHRAFAMLHRRLRETGSAEEPNFARPDEWLICRKLLA